MTQGASPAQGKHLVLMGRFGAPCGVRGEIRLQSFTAEPAAIASYGPLFDKSGTRHFNLLGARPQGKGVLVVRVEGVHDRDAAQKLNGLELYLPRENLPEPEEDEFYLADLVGLRAETEGGAALGRVIALRNFGAGDRLAVRRSGRGESVYFPFTKAVVPVIDIIGGRLVVVPPDEIDAEERPSDADAQIEREER